MRGEYVKYLDSVKLDSLLETVIELDINLSESILDGITNSINSAKGSMEKGLITKPFKLSLEKNVEGKIPSANDREAILNSMKIYSDLVKVLDIKSNDDKIKAAKLALLIASEYVENFPSKFIVDEIPKLKNFISKAEKKFAA